jgi:hypothetical protein
LQLPATVERNTNKDVDSGYAGLTAGGLLETGELPSSVGSEILPLWAPTTAYTVGQQVAYANQHYSCAVAHTSASTFSSSYWTSLSGLPSKVIVLTPKGGGADDTSWLQTAITNAAAGTVFLFNGVMRVSSQIVYKGGCSYIGLGPALEQSAGLFVASGSNIQGGVFVPDGWAANSTTASNPVIIDNLSINCNAANNPTGTECGIVLCNFWSKVSRNYVQQTNSHGLLLTDTTANGTTYVTKAGGGDPCSENRITENHFANIGANSNIADGIHKTSNSTNGANYDVYCRDNTFDTTSGSYAYINAAGDWWFEGNHGYFAQQHGFVLLSCDGTHILNNFVENCGLAGGAVQYTALEIGLSGGHPVTVAGNDLWINEPSGSSATWNYIYINAGTLNYDQAISFNRDTLKSYGVATGIPLRIYNGGTGRIFLEGMETITVADQIQPTLAFPYYSGSTGATVRRKFRKGLPRPASGQYVAPSGMIAPISTSTTVTTNNRMYLCPVDISDWQEFQAIAAYCSSIGSATGLNFRFGIYADNGYGSAPALAAPILDAGTVSVSGAGAAAVTGLTEYTPPGRYWIACAFQATAIGSGVVMNGGAYLPGMPFNSLNTQVSIYAFDGVSGALPTLTSSLFETGVNPVITLQAT